MTNKSDLTLKRKVARWMIQNASGVESMTQLAEDAVAEFDIPDECLDDPLHWMWELAFEANCLERTNADNLH